MWDTDATRWNLACSPRCWLENASSSCNLTFFVFFSEADGCREEEHAISLQFQYQDAVIVTVGPRLRLKARDPG